jgi:hypothetical protein
LNKTPRKKPVKIVLYCQIRKPPSKNKNAKINIAKVGII